MTSSLALSSDDCPSGEGGCLLKQSQTNDVCKYDLKRKPVPLSSHTKPRCKVVKISFIMRLLPKRSQILLSKLKLTHKYSGYCDVVVLAYEIHFIDSVVMPCCRTCKLSLDDVTDFGNVQWTTIREHFLTRPTVDMAVDKTDIQRARVLICEYLSHVSCHVVYLWSHQQSIMKSSSERKQSEWDTESICANQIASSGIGSLCQTRNDAIYIPSWRTPYMLTTRVWFLGYILLSGSQLGICMSRYQIA